MLVSSYLDGKPASAQDKIDRIIKAATLLFAQKGFYGTAVPEVSRAANVAAGTIYRYFSDKDDLANAVFQSSKLKLKAYLEQGVFDDANASIEAQFGLAWDNLCKFALDNPQDCTFLELHDHSKYLDRQSKRIERSVIAPFILYLSMGRKAGVIKDLPAIMLVAMVWGVFVGLFKADTQGYQRITPTVVADAKELCWQLISK